jgi:hypothetical protein
MKKAVCLTDKQIFDGMVEAEIEIHGLTFDTPEDRSDYFRSREPILMHEVLNYRAFLRAIDL